MDRKVRNPDSLVQMPPTARKAALQQKLIAMLSFLLLSATLLILHLLLWRLLSTL
jgi:hypothetical protein